MRLFVAIEIDKPVIDRIEKMRKRLKTEVSLPRGSVKWVEAENTHLTLVFLGEVPDNRVVEVCNIVQQAASPHQAFDLEIKGMGTFGRPVRVAWVGISDSQPMKVLQRDISNGFEQAGWPIEKREFSGHLTLCRVKIPSAGDILRQKIESLRNEPFGSSGADSVCVFASELSGGGPTYTVVKRINLK